MLDTNDKYLAKSIKEISPPNRRKLGEILTLQGILTTYTVDRILTLSKNSGRRFGTVLEELGLVTGEELAQALAIQYNYKIVRNFVDHPFPETLLQLISMEAAIEHLVFPLKVQNNTLMLAMTDPTNERFLDNLKQNIQMQVYPFIATRKDINHAIAKHYLKQTLPEKEEKTILVVDGDKLILSMISGMLKGCEHKIILAADGMEAFKKIVCNKPKLIIADKETPKFNGYALLDSLKSLPETKIIPVILISNSTDPDEEAAAYEKGFSDYIMKPLKGSTLNAKVNRALKNHRPLFSN